MKVDRNQMLVLMSRLNDNQFGIIGDFEGTPPQLVGKLRDATPEQIGRAFGAMVSMMEHYLMQMRSQMSVDKTALEELDSYYEMTRKQGYTPPQD